MYGSADAGDMIQIKLGSKAWKTLVDQSGTWQYSFEPSDIPSDSTTRTFVVTAFDPSDNSSQSVNVPLLIDSKLPSTPSLSPNLFGDGAITPSELSSPLQISGTASLDSVLVEIDFVGYTLASNPTDGKWTAFLDPSHIPITNQEFPLTITSYDQAGNKSSFAKDFIIATQPPLSPSIDSISQDNTLNASEKFSKISLSGTVNPDLRVGLSFAGKTYTVDPDADGVWAAELPFPSADGTHQVEAYSFYHSSYLSEVTESAFYVDTDPPKPVSAILADDTVVIAFTDKLRQDSILPDSFDVVQDYSSLPIDSVVISDSSLEVIIRLLSAPTTTSKLSVNYNPPSSSLGSILDLAGNPAPFFYGQKVETLISSSSVDELHSSFKTVVLNGPNALTLKGNASSNSITGNEYDNIIEGGPGPDSLTGGLGDDVFSYPSLSHSSLGSVQKPAFDVITDFDAFTDKLRLPSPVTSFDSNIELPTLSYDVLSAYLDDNGVGPGQSFAFNVGSRSFVFVNDGVSGYSASSDLIVEITDHTGVLSDQIFI